MPPLGTNVFINYMNGSNINLTNEQLILFNDVLDNNKLNKFKNSKNNNNTNRKNAKENRTTTNVSEDNNEEVMKWKTNE